MARRFIGLRELGAKGQDHPFIQWGFSLCGYGYNTPDETPWCSALLHGICWPLGLVCSGSASARSWLRVGREVEREDATIGHDVVVLKRGAGYQPGPEILAAPGHVGFFAGWEGDGVLILGGNQSNSVSIARFSADRILGIRRLEAA